jgi:hypothetical protein
MTRRSRLNTVTLREYLDALREADQRALAIKEKADERALNLQAETQQYKDEKANELRSQIESERGNYVTRDQHQALIDKFDAALKPLTEFMTSQIASGAGARNYRAEQLSERVSQYSSPFRANAAIVVAGSLMTPGELYRRTRPVEHTVAAACGYEAVAICWPASRLPTLSALQRKHRAVGAIVVGFLAYHFLRYPKESTDAAARQVRTQPPGPQQAPSLPRRLLRHG